jgi:hypothetical protein
MLAGLPCIVGRSSMYSCTIPIVYKTTTRLLGESIIAHQQGKFCKWNRRPKDLMCVLVGTMWYARVWIALLLVVTVNNHQMAGGMVSVGIILACCV